MNTAVPDEPIAASSVARGRPLGCGTQGFAVAEARCPAGYQWCFDSSRRHRGGAPHKRMSIIATSRAATSPRLSSARGVSAPHSRWSIPNHLRPAAVGRAAGGTCAAPACQKQKRGRQMPTPSLSLRRKDSVCLWERINRRRLHRPSRLGDCDPAANRHMPMLGQPRATLQRSR